MSSLIRMCEKDDVIIDYDKDRKMYRVSIFEDYHFKDEYWFEEYKDKEVDDRVNKIVKKLESNKATFKQQWGRNKCLDSKGMEHYLNLLINWIKDLSKSP